MLETRRVTHLWIQALPSPDIGRQRVFTACLWKLKRVLADPPLCSSPDSSRVCIAVGLERGPLERCRWRGQPGTRIFGFWILVELRIAPPPSPDRGASIRFPKLLKHTLLKAVHKHMQPLPEVCLLPSPGLWILDSGLTQYKPLTISPPIEYLLQMLPFLGPRTLDSGLGMVQSSLPLWTPDSGLRTLDQAGPLCP